MALFSLEKLFAMDKEENKKRMSAGNLSDFIFGVKDITPSPPIDNRNEQKKLKKNQNKDIHELLVKRFDKAMKNKSQEQVANIVENIESACKQSYKKMRFINSDLGIPIEDLPDNVQEFILKFYKLDMEQGEFYQ